MQTFSLSLSVPSSRSLVNDCAISKLFLLVKSFCDRRNKVRFSWYWSMGVEGRTKGRMQGEGKGGEHDPICPQTSFYRFCVSRGPTDQPAIGWHVLHEFVCTRKKFFIRNVIYSWKCILGKLPKQFGCKKRNNHYVMIYYVVWNDILCSVGWYTI